MDSFDRRLHAHVKCRSVASELRTNYTGQPLNGGAQVLGIHLLQFDRNRDVERSAFTPLQSMCEQTAAQHSSKAHDRPTFARGAFVTSAVADDLAIKAEDCVPEREDVFVRLMFQGSGHKRMPRREYRTGSYISSRAKCSALHDKRTPNQVGGWCALSRIDDLGTYGSRALGPLFLFSLSVATSFRSACIHETPEGERASMC